MEWQKILLCRQHSGGCCWWWWTRSSKAVALFYYHLFIQSSKWMWTLRISKPSVKDLDTKSMIQCVVKWVRPVFHHKADEAKTGGWTSEKKKKQDFKTAARSVIHLTPLVVWCWDILPKDSPVPTKWSSFIRRHLERVAASHFLR